MFFYHRRDISLESMGTLSRSSTDRLHCVLWGIWVMGKWFVMASFVLAFGWGHAPTHGAEKGIQTAAQRRMSRLITGRSEPARLKTVAMLRIQPDLLHQNLDVVVDATRELLQQHGADEDEDNDRMFAADRVPVPESILQLLSMLGGSLSPDAHAVVIEAMGHSDDRISMIAMDVAGQCEINAAVEGLQDQIMRSEFEKQYAYRFALVRAMAQLHCPRSVELLHKLQKQLQGQLRHEIANRLEKVDLRDFGGDREAYANYCKEHPAESMIRPVSFVAEEVEPEVPGRLTLQDVASESTGGLKLSKSHYYGIDLNAGRMLFVIDRSGSMKNVARYETRLQSAKRELIRVIEGLSPDAEFSIMLFDTYVQTWKKDLLPATDDNKRQAIAFVERIALGDKTNTHGVLSDALGFHDQLEVVFVLTDGQPTFGKVMRPDAILQDIVGRNRMRHLKFHAIGVGVSPMTGEFLKTLAERTGGEFREVE
ncbi:VWA domain-containing protein [Rhodopirellula sp. SWK7]|uniref:VWA domain-containing protein n=1 Tax=Rhodopirellula sp. SWK7 TaxID=595460 RepID=UPI001181B675|nr:VWA domain-containing protein [Rhodopirellula sp. SWK7]